MINADRVRSVNSCNPGPIKFGEEEDEEVEGWGCTENERPDMSADYLHRRHFQYAGAQKTDGDLQKDV